MELRRSKYLFIELGTGGSFLVHAYLQDKHLRLGGSVMNTIRAANNWISVEDLVGKSIDMDSDTALAVVGELVESRILIIRDSQEALREADLNSRWDWGQFAAAYHNLMRHTEHLDGESGEQWFIERTKGKPSPPLMEENSTRAVALPKFGKQVPTVNAFATMLARQSRREFLATEISLQTLSDCLFAAKGLRKEIDVDVYGRLPLTMTPSGGSRNPYELYVVASRVTGLDRGVYHYSIKAHSLEILESHPGPEDYEWLMGKQEWAAKSAATIVMVANFPRAMWKYSHGQAYKAVLIEAGAMLQNILLAAAVYDLAASPSGAFHIRQWEKLLGLDPTSQAPLMAVSMGVFDPESTPDGPAARVVWRINEGDGPSPREALE